MFTPFHKVYPSTGHASAAISGAAKLIKSAGTDIAAKRPAAAQKAINSEIADLTKRINALRLQTNGSRSAITLDAPLVDGILGWQSTLIQRAIDTAPSASTPRLRWPPKPHNSQRLAVHTQVENLQLGSWYRP
jgi:hypothetical protein